MFGLGVLLPLDCFVRTVVWTVPVWVCGLN